jgi:hypothetical protein
MCRDQYVPVQIGMCLSKPLPQAAAGWFENFANCCRPRADLEMCLSNLAAIWPAIPPLDTAPS